MILAVFFGSRDWTSKVEIEQALDELIARGELVVMNGAAPGADRIAHRAAKKRKVKSIEVPAEWDVYGKAAGPLRNQSMVEEAGIWQRQGWRVVGRGFRLPGASPGTDDMARRLRAAGYPGTVNGVPWPPSRSFAEATS